MGRRALGGGECATLGMETPQVTYVSPEYRCMDQGSIPQIHGFGEPFSEFPSFECCPTTVENVRNDWMKI